MENRRPHPVVLALALSVATVMLFGAFAYGAGLLFAGLLGLAALVTAALTALVAVPLVRAYRKDRAAA